MSARDSLAGYLDLMERRLRLLAWTRGTAAICAAALVLTIAMGWTMTRVILSPLSIVWFRAVLFLCIVIVAACVLLMPLLRLNKMVVARELERRFRRFDHGLLTFTERWQTGSPDPFLPLLAEKTLAVAQDSRPGTFVPQKTLIGNAAMSAISGIALVWLILRGSGTIASDARVLWTARSIFGVEVKPGRKTVRRGSDLAVTARLNGFAARNADLLVRYAGSTSWKRSPMQAVEGDSEFRFELTRLPGSAQFYVESEGIRSPVASVNAIDLPAVKSITVTYTNPSQDATGGDVVAFAGTVANLEIETDRPMSGGELVLEEGDPVNLAATQDNKTSASLRILRDDGYHVSVMYGGEAVQVGDEHSIEALFRDSGKGKGTSLLNGVRSGPVPAGYERAVAEYYKRLSAATNPSTKGGR